jgi:hypothetical protein
MVVVFAPGTFLSPCVARAELGTKLIPEEKLFPSDFEGSQAVLASPSGKDTFEMGQRFRKRKEHSFRMWTLLGNRAEKLRRV